MKVAIRDDDTCYFTSPRDLERVYGRIWNEAPVCLATIPFAKGYKSPAVPQAYWASGEAFALERNHEVSAFLRELVSAGRATIALHGYTHEDFPSGWEFQAAPDPDRRVREGLSYLRQLLDADISIFVPPHNALSKAGLEAISAARLNLLGSFLSFHPSRRPFELNTMPNWWRVQRFRARTGRTRRDPMVYPYPLRYGRHAEFGCHSLVPTTTLDALVKGFEEARSVGGDFCLATHYWEIDDRLHGILDDFLAHAARYSDVRFVGAEELFDRPPSLPATSVPAEAGGTEVAGRDGGRDWGARAASLYTADYARRYRSADDQIRHGALVTRFGEWLGRVCDSFGRDVVALDLGCGTGRYFWALRHVSALVGIDISHAMLAEARQPVDAGKIDVGSVTLIRDDFLTYTFKPQCFDLVYAIGVLGEHVPFDRAIATRVHAWLAPGGRFAFTSVHRESFSVPRTLKRRAGELALTAMPSAIRDGLRNRLLDGGLYVDEEYLRDVLEAAGFEIESVERHESDVHLHCLSVARKAGQ